MSEPSESEKIEDGGGPLVTPRFDEEETVLAQPVVPLDADAEPPPAEAAPYAATSAPYAPAPRRAQWPLALVLVSALAGSVVGGTALYFFQKHRRAEAPAAATAPQPAPEPDAEPQPTPTAEQAAEAAPAASEPEPEPVEDAPRDVEDDDRADRIPTPAPPPVHDDGAPKRGKKVEDEDDEPRRRGRRADREDDARPSGGGREARRVDSIVYPSPRAERREQRRAQRRAERRERRAARDLDRVRAIFEGQP